MLVLASLAALADTPRSIPVDQVAKTVRARSGSVVLVNVWATWCGYCKQEFDPIDDLSETLAPRGLSVAALALDNSATPVERFLADKQTSWAQYHVTGGSGASVVRAIGDLGGSFRGILPYHLVLDSDGRVLDEWSGARSPDEIERRLSKHLPEGTSGPSFAEIAAVEQGTVRIVLAGREGDAVYVDGWNAGVLPLETELVGGLHTFRVEGEQGRVEVQQAIDFSGGTPTIDLAATTAP